MKSLQSLLTLLAITLPLIAHSHEARVNPEQRAAIRERLQARGCLRGMGGIARGATRGVSRGTSRSANRGLEEELPPAAEQYSNYFSQVIPVELDLAYGRPGDPKAHVFFRSDPHEGAAKIAVQKELGIHWEENGAPEAGPTWIEMAKNYRAALRARGIDPSTTFVPALVLYREGQGGKREYKFIDPLSEPFPADMATWKILDKDVQFNIPFAPIFEAMQQGKFPLLDAVHDVSHFVSFLRFPEFAQSVRARVSKMTATEVTGAFKGREYWLTEALSLPDPAGQAKNHDFLRENKRSTAVRPPAEIEKELGKLGEKELVDYSYRLAKHFESQLRDVSGGNSSAAEKWYYLSESFGMRAEDLLKENVSGTQPANAALALGKVYFENATVSLNANPKALTNETATFAFNTFVTAQKLLAVSLRDKQLDPKRRKEALEQLAKFASRTEYLLASKPFTYQEWAEAFLTGDMPPQAPLAQMLTTVFPNDTMRKYYLGKGEPRPKKAAK